jgi:hypothetical protein
MSEKTFYQVTISAENHFIEIYPTENGQDIIIEAKEIDKVTPSPKMCLNKQEMQLLITCMTQMMNYLKQ